MTAENYKDYLTQAFTINRLLRAKQAQIKDLEERRLLISSMTMSSDKVQAGTNTESFNSLSHEYLDAIDEYMQDEHRLIALQADIKQLIDSLPKPTHQLIMTERYINLKRWEDIAADNGYTWKHVHRLHNAALKALEKRT